MIQINPSTRAKKGTELSFTIDMFSLAVFRNSIKKPFLRNEAKNYAMAVNKAFEDTTRTLADIKVRNKFYYTILSNTSLHTKALLNEIYGTTIIYSDGTYYQPDEDEALCVTVTNGPDSRLKSYSTTCSMEAFSTDTNLVTHANTIRDARVNNRLLSAASVLTTAYLATNNEAYKTLAAEMVSTIPADIIAKALIGTNSVNTLREVLEDVKK